MYTVIGHPQSRAFRVIWMLEELGQPYEIQPEKPGSAAVRAHNPSGKVPVLLTDEGALCDSTAIMTYLADKHGAMTAPAGSFARAQQDRMTHRILDEIDAVLWTAARHTFILPEEQRHPPVKESLKWEYTRNLDRIMEEMPGDYLCGMEPGVADLIFTHCGTWAKAAGFPAEHEGYRAYLKRMRARPAFQRTVAAGQ